MTPTPQPGPACPGYRRCDGALLGLCLTCARQLRESREPVTQWVEPAAMRASRGGTWGCANFAATRGPAGA